VSHGVVRRERYATLSKWLATGGSSSGTISANHSHAHQAAVFSWMVCAGRGGDR
jgi:hypothetical protein